MPSDTAPGDGGPLLSVRGRRPPVGDDAEATRKAIAFHLIWLLSGIIAGAGAMVFALIYLNAGDGVDTILRWMGLALGPVGALVGSAVTFYMRR
jgi:hypothetical protein